MTTWSALKPREKTLIRYLIMSVVVGLLFMSLRSLGSPTAPEQSLAASPQPEGAVEAEASAMSVELAGILSQVAGAGTLSAGAAHSFVSCLYFSAETFTSLGFGDVTPTGPVRLLAGMEALNGLLLVGWSASYIHLAMDRFWGDRRVPVETLRVD